MSRSISIFPRPVKGYLEFPSFHSSGSIFSNDIIPRNPSQSVLGSFGSPFMETYTDLLLIRNKDNALRDVFDIFQEAIYPTFPLFFLDADNTELCLQYNSSLLTTENGLSINTQYPLNVNSNGLFLDTSSLLKTENNKLTINAHPDYLRTTDDGKLEWSPPKAIGYGISMEFLASGNTLLPDLDNFDFFDFISNLFGAGDVSESGALNKPALIAKVLTGTGIKISAGKVSIDLRAGKDISIIGNTISLSADLVSRIEIAEREALTKIESSERQALTKIETGEKDALFKIETNEKETLFKIETAEKESLFKIEAAEKESLFKIESSEAQAKLSITGKETSAKAALTAQEITIKTGLTAQQTAATAAITGLETQAITAITTAQTYGLGAIGAASAAGLAAITTAAFFAAIADDGSVSLTNVNDPWNPRDAANKRYVDSMSYISVENGIYRNGNVLGIHPDLFANINSRVLSTDYSIFKISAESRLQLIETKNTEQDTSISLLITNLETERLRINTLFTTSSFQGNALNSLDASLTAEKARIDSLFTTTSFQSNSLNSLDTLKLDKTTYNANVNQPLLITSSPSFNSLLITNTVDTNSISTGSLVVNGGLGIAKNVFIGGLINCTTAPVQTQHLTNKGYVDSGLNNRVLQTTYDSYVSSNDSNVGSRLPTSTFTSYVSSNNVNVNSRVLQTVYNDYISGNNDLNTTQNNRLTSVENRATSIETDNVKKTYVDSQDSLRVLSSTYNSQINQDVRSSAIPTFSSISLPVTSASTYGFSNGSGLCYAVVGGQFASNATSNDIILRTISTGNLRFGTNSGLATLNILNTGTVSILTTNDTNSISTGSLVVNGGIGIAKNMYIGGLINCTTAPVQTQHLTNKGYVDSGLNNRVLQTIYDSYVSSNDANVGLRLPTSTFNSYVTSNDANVNSRVLQTVYNDYISTNDVLNTTQNNRLTSVENRATSIETDNVKKSYVDSQDTLRVLTTTYNSQINQDVRNSAIPTFGGIVLPITSSSTYQWSNGGGLGYALGVSNYSSNALAGDLVLRTTSSATSTNNIRIGTSSGTSTLNVLQNGQVSILTTTDSTSKSSGCLILSGGLGVAKNIYCNSLDVIGVGGANSTAIIDLSPYVPASLPATRIIATDDGNFSAKIDFQSKISGAEGNALSTKLSILTNGTISIPTTLDATGINTGSLQVSGGAYIAKNLFLTGQELNFSNASGSRIKLISTGNNYFIGAVASDNAGDFHIFNSIEGGRLFGWYRNSNTVSLGYSSGTSLVQVAGTTDTTSISSGSLVVNGGVGIAKNAFVGGSISASSISLSSTTPISIGSLYQLSVETNYLTPNFPNSKSFIIKQTVSSDQYDLFELKSKTGESVFSTQFNNGNTTLKSSLFLKSCVISFGSQTSSSQNVCNIGATGTGGGNDASMCFAINSGSSNDNAFKFYQIGSPNSPLAVITSAGDLRCSNFTSRNSATNFSQAGVTFDTVVNSQVDFTKLGRHAMVTYYFSWQNATGMATGRFTFILPFPARITTKIRGVLVGDGNSYSSNKMVNYNVDITELSSTATLYSDLNQNIPPGGGGGITFHFSYPIN